MNQVGLKIVVTLDFKEFLDNLCHHIKAQRLLEIQDIKSLASRRIQDFNFKKQKDFVGYKIFAKILKG